MPAVSRASISPSLRCLASSNEPGSRASTSGIAPGTVCGPPSTSSSSTRAPVALRSRSSSSAEVITRPPGIAFGVGPRTGPACSRSTGRTPRSCSSQRASASTAASAVAAEEAGVDDGAACADATLASVQPAANASARPAWGTNRPRRGRDGALERFTRNPVAGDARTPGSGLPPQGESLLSPPCCRAGSGGRSFERPHQRGAQSGGRMHGGCTTRRRPFGCARVAADAPVAVHLLRSKKNT